MPKSSTQYEILIASPGDVDTERGLVAEVIHEWNSSHSRASGAQLGPVRWELDAVPELGDRPQGLINKQLVDDADMVIALLSTRLGSPTGIADSGTVEEIERLRTAGKHVMVYFSAAPLPRDHDPEQLRMLNEYKSKLKAQGLFFEFSSEIDLWKKLTRHLASVMSQEMKSKPESPQAKPKAANLRIFRRGWKYSGEIRTADIAVDVTNGLMLSR